jgi:hypothetical protein
VVRNPGTDIPGCCGQEIIPSPQPLARRRDLLRRASSSCNDNANGTTLFQANGKLAAATVGASLERRAVLLLQLPHQHLRAAAENDAVPVRGADVFDNQARQRQTTLWTAVAFGCDLVSTNKGPELALISVPALPISWPSMGECIALCSPPDATIFSATTVNTLQLRLADSCGSFCLHLLLQAGTGCTCHIECIRCPDCSCIPHEAQYIPAGSAASCDHLPFIDIQPYNTLQTTCTCKSSTGESSTGVSSTGESSTGVSSTGVSSTGPILTGSTNSHRMAVSRLSLSAACTSPSVPPVQLGAQPQAGLCSSWSEVRPASFRLAHLLRDAPFHAGVCGRGMMLVTEPHNLRVCGAEEESALFRQRCWHLLSFLPTAPIASERQCSLPQVHLLILEIVLNDFGDCTNVTRVSPAGRVNTVLMLQLGSTRFAASHILRVASLSSGCRCCSVRPPLSPNQSSLYT